MWPMIGLGMSCLGIIASCVALAKSWNNLQKARVIDQKITALLKETDEDA